VKHSKLFIKYHAKIVLNELGDSDIIGLKSHLNRSRQNSTLSETERDELHELVQNIHPIITPAQTEKGLRWLKACRYEFSEFQKLIIGDFDQFRLVDFIDESVGHELRNYRPVYRVEGKQGAFFDYYAYPWQTGAYSGKGQVPIKIL